MPVPFTQILNEQDEVAMCFQRLTYRVPEWNIVVTPEMRELYRAIVGGVTEKYIFLKGSVGLGKTTTLFWLYCQLKSQSQFFTVVVPFASLESDYDRVIYQINQCEAGAQLVILMDLVSPTMRTTTNSRLFFQICCKSQCVRAKMVIALSSSFALYKHFQVIDYCTEWCECFLVARHFKLKPFSDALARQFLLDRNVEPQDLEEMVKCSQGIPKLLSFGGYGMERFKEALCEVRKNEFLVVLNFMKKNGILIEWKKELDLLVAAKYELQLDHIGLAREEANQLALCWSYLIEIKDDVPVPFFPGGKYLLEAMMKQIWSTMSTRMLPMIDSESVIGEYFEFNVPNIICKSLNLQLKKVQGELTLGSMGCTLDFCHRRLEDGDTIPNQKTLWRTPKAFKPIDFFAIVDAQLSMPARKALLAIQVTTKVKGRKEKITRSIAGISKKVSSEKDVIFILINPHWTEFEENYRYAVDATTGPAGERFNSFWYGQPACFSAYKVLFRELQTIFEVVG